MSLEEKRAERRRRRQMEEEAPGGGDTDISTSDDYSSRRNRHHGTDNDITQDTPVVNDISSVVPDTSEEDKAAERRRRQQEEEEGEARRQAEREAEEERQRQAALERQRKEAEEAARRRAEERERQEEEERQRRPFQDDSFESGSLKSLDEEGDNSQGENKLFIDEDGLEEEDSAESEKGARKVFSDTIVDKTEDIKSWNKDSHKNKVERTYGFESERFSSETVESKEKLTTEISAGVREVNNNKIKDKLELFEHLKEDVDTAGRRTVLLPLTDGEGLKGKLAKFEQEIRDQEAGAKEVPAGAARTKKEFMTPQPHKLSQKLQHFESAVKSQSTTKSRDVQKPDVREAIARKNVLERWKLVEKNTQETEPVKSPLERKESLQKRLSGNTEFIASKYIEKASKSIDESANLPRSSEPTLRSEPALRSPLSPLSSPKSEVVHKASIVFENQEVPPGVNESTPRAHNFSVEITIVPSSKSKLSSQWPPQDGNVARGQNSEKPHQEVCTEDNLEHRPQSRVTDQWPHGDELHRPQSRVTDQWPHGDELTDASSLGAVNGRASHSRDSSMDKGTSLHSRDSSMDKGTSLHSRNSSMDKGTGLHSRDLSMDKGTSLHSRDSSINKGTSLHSRDSSMDKGTSLHSRDSSMDKGTSLHSRDSSMDKSVHSTDSSFDTSSESPKASWSQKHQEEEEAELERKQKEEKEARQAKMAEDDSKKKRGKRKGLGGLTPEKKKKLKDFIGEVTYTVEEHEEKMQELSYRVLPLPDDLDHMTPDELRKFIKSLHEKLAQIHSEAYDIEFKLNKQDKEVADLNMKISDSRGRFAKPVLRKVNKTEQKFAALSKDKKEHSDFRETLKSVHDDEEN